MRSAISPNDPRIAVLVSALDREDAPMAETWREVVSAAERVGLWVPSYQHVRRLVRIERRRRELERQGREVWGDVAKTLAAGRVPSAVHVLERPRPLELRVELVIQEHKAFGRGGDPGETAGTWEGELEPLGPVPPKRVVRGATGPGRRSRGP